MVPGRVSVLEGLRARVRGIEQRVERFRPARATVPEAAILESTVLESTVAPPDALISESWTLGDEALDAALGVHGQCSGLDICGLHEVKPALSEGACAASLQAAALGFALRLAVRRMAGLAPARRNARTGQAAPLIVWCQAAAVARETGDLYGPGLAALGLDPSSLLLVETARTCDTLWGMEDALRSGACVLVAGALNSIDLTAARRLALAAKAGSTPALLLTHAARPGAAAVASRWRVGARPSASHPLDPHAPGGFAAAIGLERCRGAPALTQSSPFVVEWCDETHRFRLSAAVADRAPCEEVAPARLRSR